MQLHSIVLRFSKDPGQNRSLVPLSSLKRRLVIGAALMRLKKPRSRDIAGTSPERLKSRSAKHSPIFCSPSPTVVTSQCELNIFEQEVKQQTNRRTNSLRTVFSLTLYKGICTLEAIQLDLTIFQTIVKDTVGKLLQQKCFPDKKVLLIKDNPKAT